MSEEYEIRTVKHIADLTPRQQTDFLKDLEAWLEINNAAKEWRDAGLPIQLQDDRIIWKDDGKNGMISEVSITLINTPSN